MAFIIENDITVSFAEYDDVLEKDQRLFESNEGLTDDIVEEFLIRATERILNRFRSSAWWKDYYTRRSGASISTVADIPALDPNKILARQNDFTDLCVYSALAEYVLPKVADFGNEDNAERQKMGYYQNKTDSLFAELVTAGDWYDFDDDASISSGEKQPGQINLKRIR
tara:strand:- start:454 stop:960 length:507 start_codon:yes stop_codon:yes gene_type:complete